MYRISLFLLLSFSVTFGSAFRIESISKGNSYPQRNTSYLRPISGNYLKSVSSISDGIYLRRRFSASEYRLYLGGFTELAESAEGNIQRFIRPGTMDKETFYSLKYYDRKRMNGQGDITDCYFHGDTLFIVGLIRVLFMNGTEWEYIDAGGAGKQLGTGDIAVQSSPSGARIFLDGDDRGVETPNYLTTIRAGKHRVRLEHPDFAPVETTVIIQQNNIQTLDIQLTSRYGAVSFTGFPRGATVRLDGRQVGKLPCTVNGLRPGSYTFSVDEPFHKRKQVPVEVRSGGNSQVAVILSKAYGVISLPHLPVNSPWQINGEMVASGDLRYNPGTHRLFWDGGGVYKSIDTVISLGLGDTVDLEMRFAKKTGGIKVLPIPMACSLFVDGSYRGQAPCIAEDLTVGKHTVELRRAGYRTFTTTVNIDGDKIVPLQCQLVKGGGKNPSHVITRTQQKPIENKVSKGELSFVSFPPCAEVYSGDSLVAITGKGTVQIPVGRYSFRFVSGEQTAIRTVSVLPGDKKAVLVTFGEL